MTNPTPHGQVPEALIDLIDAYAETRHRCGGIYNAKTEAARKAVIEALSGVQALSAAQAVDIATVGEAQAFEAWYKQDCVIEGAAAKMAAKAAWKARAMLAASPTPPAEQQAGATTSETVPFVDKSTADPVEKARRYLTAMGDNRLHSTYFFDDGFPKQESASDALATLAILEQLAAPQQAAPKAAPGAPAAIKMVGYGGCTGINDYLMSDGTIKTMRQHEVVWRETPLQAVAGEPVANDIHGALTAAAIYLTNAQRQYGKEMHRQAIASLEKAQRAVAQAADCAKAAPKQEPQEPALFVSPKQLAALTDPDDPEGEHGRYLPVRKTTKGLFTQALYTAPQPAPAPATPDGDELRKIARAARTSASDDASPTEYVLAGWRAALAAQGSKA